MDNNQTNQDFRPVTPFNNVPTMPNAAQPNMPTYQPPVTYGAPIEQPAMTNNSQPQSNLSQNPQVITPSAQPISQPAMPNAPIQPAGATAVPTANSAKHQPTPQAKRAQAMLIAAIIIAVITLSTVAICAYLFAAA